MESFVHSLNYMLPQELHFSNDNIQQILENSHNRSIRSHTNTINITAPVSIPAVTTATATATATPTTTIESSTILMSTSIRTALAETTNSNSIASEFLRKLGATVLNSIQLQQYQQEKQDNQYRERFGLNLTRVAATAASTTASLLNINYNQQQQEQQSYYQQYHQQQQQQSQQHEQYFLLDNQQQQQQQHNIEESSISSTSTIDMNILSNNHYLYHNDPVNYTTIDELQKQLEYDKFMNEVWIGVVLTLIFISMIFCFCSCFLYHQFVIWKRNYRSTLVQSQSLCDIDEPLKLNTEFNDPVPEYTLVSGLPSYEAALELLHKTKETCSATRPNIFNIFEFDKLRHNDDNHNSQNNNGQFDSDDLESIKIINIYTKTNNNSSDNNNSDNNNYNNNSKSKSHNDINNDVVTTPFLTEQLPMNDNTFHSNNNDSFQVINVIAVTHLNENEKISQSTT